MDLRSLVAETPFGSTYSFPSPLLKPNPTDDPEMHAVRDVVRGLVIHTSIGDGPPLRPPQPVYPNIGRTYAHLSCGKKSRKGVAEPDVPNGPFPAHVRRLLGSSSELANYSSRHGPLRAFDVMFRQRVPGGRIPTKRNAPPRPYAPKTFVSATTGQHAPVTPYATAQQTLHVSQAAEEAGKEVEASSVGPKVPLCECEKAVAWEIAKAARELAALALGPDEISPPSLPPADYLPPTCSLHERTPPEHTAGKSSAELIAGAQLDRMGSQGFKSVLLPTASFYDGHITAQVQHVKSLDYATRSHRVELAFSESAARGGGGTLVLSDSQGRVISSAVRAGRMGNVCMFAASGCDESHVPALVAFASRTYQDLVGKGELALPSNCVLAIGGNTLYANKAKPERLATRLLAMAADLKLAVGVPSVTILLPSPRQGASATQHSYFARQHRIFYDTIKRRHVTNLRVVFSGCSLSQLQTDGIHMTFPAAFADFSLACKSSM